MNSGNRGASLFAALTRLLGTLLEMAKVRLALLLLGAGVPLRSAQLRCEVSQQAQAFRRPLALADTARDGVHWLYRNPVLGAGWPGAVGRCATAPCAGLGCEFVVGLAHAAKGAPLVARTTRATALTRAVQGLLLPPRRDSVPLIRRPMFCA